MAVSIEAGDAVKPGVPEALFETRIRSSNRGTPLPAYDVTSDGERFLIANQTDEAMTLFQCIGSGKEESSRGQNAESGHAVGSEPIPGGFHARTLLHRTRCP